MSDEAAKQPERAELDVTTQSVDELVRELASITSNRRSFLVGTSAELQTAVIARPDEGKVTALLIALGYGLCAGLHQLVEARVTQFETETLACRRYPSFSSVERVGWGEALLQGAGGLLDLCPETPTYAMLERRGQGGRPRKRDHLRRARTAG